MKTLEERIQLAKQGKNLEELVKDPDWNVRWEVAKHKKDNLLDILVKDEHPEVRASVLISHRRDKDLDILVNDEDFAIRAIIARFGRKQDLEKLQFDKNKEVRERAQKRLNLNVVNNRKICYNKKENTSKERN